MTDRIFVDSNIWVYLFAKEDSEKHEKVMNFFSDIGKKRTLVISYQVVNEVSRILKKKGLSEVKIREIIELLAINCTIQDFSKELALLASVVRERYMVAFWDSHIVASAITARCGHLISEDMHDGFRVYPIITTKQIFEDFFARQGATNAAHPLGAQVRSDEVLRKKTKNVRSWLLSDTP